MKLRTRMAHQPGKETAKTELQRTSIEPQKGWQLINWMELWKYRDLLYFLVWRDIKARYAQSVLGLGWAIIQPIATMIVFTVVFGNLAKISSDGVPYAIFSFTALVPWNYFSSSLTGATGSLIQSKNLLTKVYCPRLVIPIASVLGKLVDFSVSLILLFGMMAWFGVVPTIWALMLPVLVLLMMLTSAGLGMWFAAASVQYRDIRYGVSFLIRLLMYAAPVVYPASLLPDKYRLIYGLYPMAGVIESFRSALLRTNPMPWDLLAMGSITAVILFVTGALYFRRVERVFADVV